MPNNESDPSSRHSHHDDVSFLYLSSSSFMSESLRSPGGSQGLLPKTFSNALSLAVTLSLVLFTYERAVIPIYASVPTRLYLPHFALLALTIPHFQPFKHPRRLLQWKWFVAGLALALAPNAMYWVAIWTARWKDPYLGPVVLHAVVLVPLVSAIANCTVVSALILMVLSESFVDPTSVSQRCPKTYTFNNEHGRALCVLPNSHVSCRHSSQPALPIRCVE